MSNLQEILTDPHICGAVCTLVDVLELLTCLVNVLHVLQVQRLKVEIVQAPVNLLYGCHAQWYKHACRQQSLAPSDQLRG